MPKRKMPSEKAAERKVRPAVTYGAKPRDLRAQELAQEVGSSRMGEIQLSEGQKNRKAGIGEVRRAERRQELIDEGRFNRIAHRMKYGKKTSI